MKAAGETTAQPEPHHKEISRSRKREGQKWFIIHVRQIQLGFSTGINGQTVRLNFVQHFADALRIKLDARAGETTWRTRFISNGFSERNGCIVIESADYELTISAPEWRNDSRGNEQRARDATNGLNDFMQRLTGSDGDE